MYSPLLKPLCRTSKALLALHSQYKSDDEAPDVPNNLRILKRRSMNLSQEQIPTRARGGTACLVCRRRKIKCDCSRPVCQACVRGGYQDECEYVMVGPSRTQILEETVAQLQARIKELEAGAPAEREMRSTELLSPSQSLVPQNLGDTVQEPPSFIIRTLLHTFVHAAPSLGFFLEPRRFREAALKPLALGHPSRPLPALMNTVYLWAVFLSQNGGATETALVERSVQLIRDAPASNHPSKVLHTVQAQLLIALYFFVHGQILDGQRHLRAVVNLAFQVGLHQHRTDESNLNQSLLDDVDQQERLMAFWAVFNSINQWSAAFGFSSGVSYNDPRTRIDTPWPVEDISACRGQNSGSTVVGFLQSVIDTYHSEDALLAKSSVLYERSVRLFSSNKNQPTPSSAVFQSMNQLILKLRLHAPTLEQARQGRFIWRAIVWLSLLHAATIHLHLTASRHVCCEAAREIIVWGEEFVSQGEPHKFVPPVIYVVWGVACRAIIEQITFLRSGGVAIQTDEGEFIEIPALMRVLERGMDTMRKSAVNPLSIYQYTKVEEAFTAL